MKNIVSSLATVNANGAQRLSVTYSKVDDLGRIIEDNIRTNRIVLDDGALSAIQTLTDFAQKIVDSEQ
ncbi:MAG: hypothetical protein HDQ95_01500 [Roseburia sp.]|nr:hypothetical protein [Roseburia sp.]